MNRRTGHHADLVIQALDEEHADEIAREIVSRASYRINIRQNAVKITETAHQVFRAQVRYTVDVR